MLTLRPEKTLFYRFRSVNINVKLTASNPKCFVCGRNQPIIGALGTIWPSKVWFVKYGFLVLGIHTDLPQFLYFSKIFFSHTTNKPPFHLGTAVFVFSRWNYIFFDEFLLKFTFNILLICSTRTGTLIRVFFFNFRVFFLSVCILSAPIAICASYARAIHTSQRGTHLWHQSSVHFIGRVNKNVIFDSCVKSWLDYSGFDENEGKDNQNSLIFGLTGLILLTGLATVNQFRNVVNDFARLVVLF